MLDLYERGDVKAEIFYFEKFKIGKYTRILDIGANSGPFINSLHNIGYWYCFGIDINEDAVNEGVKIYPNISDNLQIYDGKRIPFADEAFGVVTMFDVLEHIPANDIKQLLSEILRVLKPSGLFVFKTPNKFINIPWEIMQHRSLTLWKTYHVSLQNCYQLYRILDKAGFIQIQIEKGNVDTEFNRKRLKQTFGYMGVIFLYIAKRLPLFLSPQFWGSCKKNYRLTTDRQ